MKRRSKSSCPIAFFLDSFGDRWTLLVLRDLLIRGSLHYGDFVNSKENIATNILAARLKVLMEQGLITRREDPDNKSKTLYALTAKGRALLPVLTAMAKWGLDHGPRTLRPARSPAAHSLSGADT